MEKVSKTKQIRFELPYWPPSVNGIWRPSKGRGMTLTRAAKEFYGMAPWDIRLQNRGIEPFVGPVEAWLYFTPPDCRRRDLDNLSKVTLDAVVKAGYLDDSQITLLHLGIGERNSLWKQGRIRGWIRDKATAAVFAAPTGWAT